MPVADTKFDIACTRLSDTDPAATLQAVADLNQVVVDGILHDHPEARTEDGVDHDMVRDLWQAHEAGLGPVA